jgi:hypothetical protein
LAIRSGRKAQLEEIFRSLGGLLNIRVELGN